MKYIRLIKANNKYNYMLLDRLKKDCEYFLKYPNTKHLWAGDIKQQIDKMLELYNSLDPKPEWITKEDINNYYKQMLEASDSKQIKAFDLHSIIKKIRDTLGDIADSSSASDAEWFDQGEYAYLYIPVNQIDFRKNVTTGEINEEALEKVEEMNGQKVEVIKINKTSKGFETGGIITGKPESVDVRLENGDILKDIDTMWLKHEPFGEKEAKSNYLMEAIKMIKQRFHQLEDINSWSKAEWFKEGEYAYIYVPVNQFDFTVNVTTGETDKAAFDAIKALSGQKVEILKIKATTKGPYNALTADGKPTLVDIRFEDGDIWKDVDTLWLKHQPFGEDDEERKVESKRNLSKILNPEDFDKIEKEIQSLNMAKKRIEDSIKSYEKSNNKSSEYNRSISQLKRINNELKSKLEQESLMWDELTLK